jgi:hypothetical protein
MASPVTHHQLGGAGNFPGKPHATRAHNAPVDEKSDLFSDIFATAGKGSPGCPTLLNAILKVVVLQKTLAGFVANRAIHWVTKQEVFLHHRSCLLNLGTLRHQDHPIHHNSVARRHKPGQETDFAGLRVPRANLDEAHPATADNRKARVPAVMGNFNSGSARNLDAIEPFSFVKLYENSVNKNRRHC